MAEAEEMYTRALRGKEKAWRVEYTSTLDTVNNLGALYADQGKTAKAEQMYIRALRGKVKTIKILGNLYAKQGKMAEAEEMYMRALRGKEKAWGSPSPGRHLRPVRRARTPGEGLHQYHDEMCDVWRTSHDV
jgi:tetratricopeptide (TPR) repeat protein